MRKYKDNNEAGKAYADLIYREGDNQLQHEAASLDFAAGANWKERELSQLTKSKKSIIKDYDQVILEILDRYQVECQMKYNTGTVPDARMWFAKNYE